MVEVPRDMIGLEAASAELDAMEAAEAAAAAPPARAAATADPSANLKAGDRAPQPEGDQPLEPGSISTDDTPATAETPEAKTAAKEAAAAKAAASDAGKTLSKFAKEQLRRDKTWTQINDEKTALKTERERFERERTEFQDAQAKQAAKFTPEEYETAAKKFDEQGKFDMAASAREMAAELRKNPPPSPDQQRVLQQQQETHQAEMKQWWGKAAIDYPAVAKEGSPENAALKSFLQAEPTAAQYSKGMYYAARMISAETAAARVPEMDKELGALRARVKELEALTTPGDPRTITLRPGQEARTEEQEFEELEAAAMAMGPLR